MRQKIQIIGGRKLRNQISEKLGRQIDKKTKSYCVLLDIVMESCGHYRAVETPKRLAIRVLNYWVLDLGDISKCFQLAAIDLSKLVPSDMRPENTLTISNLPSNKFYISPEWRSLRYKTIRERGNICECCGSSPKNGIRIHVDHIKPRSIFPELALNGSNLQILCEACNLAKSNKFDDDWRC